VDSGAAVIGRDALSAIACVADFAFFAVLVTETRWTDLAAAKVVAEVPCAQRELTEVIRAACACIEICTEETRTTVGIGDTVTSRLC
jgi:hypothetical protein